MIEFTDCYINFKLEGYDRLADKGEWLLIKYCYTNKRDEIRYAVLQHVETADKRKLALFDGTFLYDFEDTIRALGYKVIKGYGTEE